MYLKLHHVFTEGVYELNILFWIIRIVMSFGIIFKVTDLAMVYNKYDSDSYLFNSAPQASQLSGEYILIGLADLSYILAGGIFFIAFELIVISYYSRKRLKVATDSYNISKKSTIATSSIKK